jgi:glycosyltransferase involved in cell wall biosynthesis
VSGEPSVAYLCLQAARQGQASYAHVHEIVDGLRRRGLGVTLFDVAYAAEGARVPGPAGRLLEFRRTQRRLAASSLGADAVYVRAHPAARPTSRWARGLGIPVVQEVNGPYADVFAAWPAMRPFERWLVAAMREQYRAADALITVTPQLAEWLSAETGRSDVHVIPNGANTSVFTPGAPRRSGLPGRYAVFFGAFAPWQGIGTLLEALRRPQWPAGVSLVLVGDGAERPAVAEAAAEDPRVVYLGGLGYRELPGVVAGALAGVVPAAGGRAATGLSPLKLYETLACGVPAIVTDFPGQADLVRDRGTGLVVPPEDPAALASAVATLAGSPQEAVAMGRRGREVVAAEHSWDARAAATAEVIASVVEARRR